MRLTDSVEKGLMIFNEKCFRLMRVSNAQASSFADWSGPVSHRLRAENVRETQEAKRRVTVSEELLSSRAGAITVCMRWRRTDANRTREERGPLRVRHLERAG